MKRIVWTKVTKFSQAVAIILALCILGLGFSLGRAYQAVQDSNLNVGWFAR